MSGSSSTRGVPPLRSVAAGAALVALAVLAGCSTSFKPDEVRNKQGITILKGAPTRGMRGLTPNPVTVTTNTLVTWSNDDTTAHEYASVGGFFQSDGPVAPGKTFSVLFANPGNFRYYCTLPGHFREQGVINVAR